MIVRALAGTPPLVYRKNMSASVLLKERVVARKWTCAERKGVACGSPLSDCVFQAGTWVDLGRVAGPQDLAATHDPKGMRLVAQGETRRAPAQELPVPGPIAAGPA